MVAFGHDNDHHRGHAEHLGRHRHRGVEQRLTVNARAAGPRLGKDVQLAIKGSKTGDWAVAEDGTVRFKLQGLACGGVNSDAADRLAEWVAPVRSHPAR